MEGAFAADALSVSWSGMYAYAFPPPVLLHLVVQKVAQEHCTLVLWYPLLLELLIDHPRKLPVIPRMLKQKRGQVVHPDPENLRLVARKISSISKLRENFLKQLRNTWKRAEDHQPKEFMMQDCEFTKDGVVSNVSVHILPL